MSIFDTMAAQTSGRPAGTPNNSNRRNQRLDRYGNPLPEAEFWVNVGLVLPVYDPETGETTDEFIGFPMGIPLDTMAEMVVRGKNERWKTIASAKNQIMKLVTEQARDTLAPGETMRLDNFVVEVRRREDPNTAAITTGHSDITQAAVLQMLSGGSIKAT